MNMPVRSDRMARFVELIEREDETLDEICQRMTNRVEGIDGPAGRPETLQEICTAWDVPFGRMMAWLMADAKRYAQYERALEMRAHALVAETVDIADGEQFPQEKRIRIETRFRLARHHAPEKYGERVQVDGGPSVLIDAGLVGTAVALLEKLSQSRSARREIDVTPVDDEGDI